MSKFVIQGGQRLGGEIRISGMKNAVTALLTATLLTREECRLDNVPRIADVETMLTIIRSAGAKAQWVSDHEVAVEAKGIDSLKLNKHMVCAMRSSVLLAGPLLARTGSLNLPEPGGCIIGNRPLDTHLVAFEAMGVKIERSNGVYELQGKPKAAEIVLPEFSVTATENVLMAAVLAPGKTVIKLAAAEPHVQDLCSMLKKMGARIAGMGTHTLVIEGAQELRGVKHTVIPDQIEVGTFAALAGATHSSLTLYPIVAEHLDSVFTALKRAGVGYESRIKNQESRISELKIFPSSSLSGFKIQALPYPGFPTDLQAPFAVLATQCKGTSLIHDPLFEGRMGYVHELIKMGANAIIADPHRVIIAGPTSLSGQEIKSLDLRAGATLVIAGLVAEGETILHDAEVIDRGYENLEVRLKAIGAEIKRVN
ncbi:MAG: UDP-N-acetylglucosamine 1-carboxyvinyltransferase [Parcubacteria group bacterium GW2011_GWA2_47_26]|nr:MAG: UDP-N-acetylglucosamine 1-carboxyvinyltransferase [Parcubacteria group bacterium GW2011_GWA2_47_26]